MWRACGWAGQLGGQAQSRVCSAEALSRSALLADPIALLRGRRSAEGAVSCGEELGEAVVEQIAGHSIYCHDIVMCCNAPCAVLYCTVHNV